MQSNELCGYCGKEILNEEGKYTCPSCGRVYHIECWNYNKGCTTAGCAQNPNTVAQGYFDVQNPQDNGVFNSNFTNDSANTASFQENQVYSDNANLPTETCRNCGAVLEPGQEFCPKCGTKRQENKRVCKNCGAVLDDGQIFCASCGYKSDPDLYPVKPPKKKRKALMITLISLASVLVCAAAAFGVIKLINPDFLVSPDVLLSQGKYQAAFNAASNDQKNEVLRENLIAYLSEESADALKNPSSFELLDAWVEEDRTSAVLYISGTNSYGGTVSSYWYYLYDEDDEEYNYIASINDFEEEETYSWDDSDDRAEKAINNASRLLIAVMIQDDSNKLSDTGIDNINNLFKTDRLEDVQLLDQKPETNNSSN